MPAPDLLRQEGARCSAFPDIQVFMDDVFFKEDRVEVHWTFTGTNTRAWRYREVGSDLRLRGRSRERTSDAGADPVVGLG
jgi:hypothetical protein